MSRVQGKQLGPRALRKVTQSDNEQLKPHSFFCCGSKWIFWGWMVAKKLFAHFLLLLIPD